VSNPQEMVLIEPQLVE